MIFIPLQMRSTPLFANFFPLCWCLILQDEPYSLSSSPLPFLSLSASSIIQRWQLLLSSGSSDPGMLWPGLASLWLPGHGGACSPGPRSPTIVFVGAILYILCFIWGLQRLRQRSAMFSSQIYALKNCVFTSEISLCHSALYFNIILLPGVDKITETFCESNAIQKNSPAVVMTFPQVVDFSG